MSLKHIQTHSPALESADYPCIEASTAFEAIQNDMNEQFKLLDIDLNSFSKIPSLANKKHHLAYKLVQKEFDLIKNKAQGLLDETSCEKKLALVNLIYTSLLNNAAPIKNHKKTYSPASVGISEWYMRSIEPNLYDEAKETAAERQSKKIKRRSMNLIKPYDKGIEPKYLAFQNEDVCLYLFDQFPDAKQRHDEIRKFQGDIVAYYQANQEKINYVVNKLTHRQINENFKVIVEKEGILQTNTVKRIASKPIVGGMGEFLSSEVIKWGKSKPVVKKSKEPLQEAIGTDFARALGFTNIHNQTMYPGFYGDKHPGILKIMLKAHWATNATLVQPLAGQPDKQYLVEPLLIARDGIANLSHHGVRLGELLVPFLFLADRDAIGSQGQNKLLKVINGVLSLYGIDFGHILADDILDKIRDDFSVDHGDFKNYTVFYDSDRSDIIRGLFLLAKTANLPIDEKILESYGVDFVKKYNSIQPNIFETILNDYEHFFTELALKFKKQPDKFSQHNMLICQELVAEIRRIKPIAARNQLGILERFKHYLNLPKTAVDVLQNIERAMAGPINTSLRSADGGVLLNHLRIIKADVKKWQTSLDDETFYFTAEFHAESDAEYGEDTLKSFLKYHANLLQVTRNKNVISISFKKSHLKEANQYFNENIIKKEFHPRDNELHQIMIHEKEIQQVLESYETELKDFMPGLNAQLTTSPEFNRLYRVTFTCDNINAENKKIALAVINSTLEKLKNNAIILKDNNDTSFFEFSAETKAEMANVLRALSGIPSQIKSRLDIHRSEKELRSIQAFADQSILPGNLEKCLVCVDDQHFNYEFTMPNKWRSTSKLFFKNHFKNAFNEEKNCFEFTRPLLNELNDIIKETIKHDIDHCNTITKEMSEFKNRKDDWQQLFFVQSIDMSLTEDSDDLFFFAFNGSSDYFLNEVMKNAGLFGERCFKTKGLEMLNARLKTVSQKFIAMRNEIGIYSDIITKRLKELKEKHGITVELIERNNDFYLKTGKEEADKLFASILSKDKELTKKSDQIYNFSPEQFKLIPGIIFDSTCLYAEEKQGQDVEKERLRQEEEQNKQKKINDALHKINQIKDKIKLNGLLQQEVEFNSTYDANTKNLTFTLKKKTEHSAFFDCIKRKLSVQSNEQGISIQFSNGEYANTALSEIDKEINDMTTLSKGTHIYLNQLIQDYSKSSLLYNSNSMLFGISNTLNIRKN